MTTYVAPLISTPPTSNPANAGPTARLIALPQFAAGLPADPEAVDDHLGRIESARQAQLDALPKDPSTLVAMAHRRTVLLILEQVAAARVRVRAGTYGLCARCCAPILRHVLESQPWQPSCSGCARSGAH